MGINLMYTLLETIFDTTMEREGRNNSIHIWKRISGVYES